MADLDVDLGEAVTLTSWTADDGTLVDHTTCLTDDNFSTACLKVGKAPEDGLKFTRNSGLGSVANGDTITFEQVSAHSMSDWALLAHSDSNSVVTTAKILVDGSSSGVKTFTLTTAFIAELGDQGSGKWSCRLVPDNDGSGDAQIAEIGLAAGPDRAVYADSILSYRRKLS